MHHYLGQDIKSFQFVIDFKLSLHVRYVLDICTFGMCGLLADDSGGPTPTFVVFLFEQLQLLMKAVLNGGQPFTQSAFRAFQLICLCTLSLVLPALKVLHSDL